MKNKNSKQAQVVNNTDFKAEFANAEQYKKLCLNSDLSFLKEAMGEEKIDAFNYASNEYGVASALKDGMKDKLKGMATLGTVRFNTVQTPKYLVLSGDNLHLFDTDTDGEIDNHFVFNQARLENSRLIAIPMEGQVQAQAQARGNNVKAYKLSLQTDEKPVELTIYSCLIFTNIPEIPTDLQETIQDIIIGNDFLKQLGDKYPNFESLHRRYLAKEGHILRKNNSGRLASYQTLCVPADLQSAVLRVSGFIIRNTPIL